MNPSMDEDWGFYIDIEKNENNYVSDQSNYIMVDENNYIIFDKNDYKKIIIKPKKNLYVAVIKTVIKTIKIIQTFTLFISKLIIMYSINHVIFKIYKVLYKQK